MDLAIAETPAPSAEPTIDEIAASMDEPAVAAPVEVAADDEPVVEAAAPEVEPVIEAEVIATAEADAAAERARVAAAKAREGSKRYAETQVRLREQAEQVQRAAREAEQLRRENAEIRQREEEYRKDPYKALKDRGVTDRELAERAMREGTPEAATARLEAQLIEERNARIALENRLTQERRAVDATRAEQRFTQIADDESAFPRLSQLSADAQLDVARAALKRIAANGHEVGRFSDAQVAEACERYLAPKRAASAPAAARSAAPVARAAASGKTLTNAQAQTRTVAAASWDSLSEEQQLAHIAASLPEP